MKRLLPVRWWKVWRDLWVYKARTLLVILSIALGVMGVGMLGQSQSMLIEGMKESYTASNPGHISILSESFDRDILHLVRQLSGVKIAEARRVIYGKIASEQKSGSGQSRTDWKELQLFAVDDFSQLSQDKVYPRRGAWPPLPGEVLLEETSLRYLGIKAGERVFIDTGGDQMQELRVAGTVRDPLRDSAYVSGRNYGYVTFPTLQQLNLPTDYNLLSLKVEGDPKDTSHLRNMAVKVRDMLNENGIQVLTIDIPPPGRHWAYDIVQSMSYILQCFGILIILTGSMLIINTIFAMLLGQIRQIGVMKVIGADPRTLLSMYLGHVAILGLVALLVGIPLGLSASSFIIYRSMELLHFERSEQWLSMTVILLQLFVGLAVPLLTAFVPILIGTSITVREAIGGQAEQSQFGSSRIERMLGNIRVLPRIFLISLRNTFRKRGRLLLTLLSLSIGGAAVLSVINVKASLDETVNDYLRYSNYDFRISYQSPQYKHDAERIAIDQREVTQVESWYHHMATRIKPDDTKGWDWMVYGVPPGSRFLSPTLVQGRWYQSGEENEIVLNSYLQRLEPDIRVGDNIALKIGSREESWRVVGFAMAPTEVDAYVSDTRLTQLLGAHEEATMLNVKTNQYGRNDQADIAESLREAFTEQGIAVNAPLLTEDVREIQETRYGIVTIFLGLMSILLMIVVGLGLLGTMSLSVMERTREIGIMRSIGASDAAIWGVVIAEGVIIGLSSVLFSVALASPISRVLCKQVGLTLFQAPLQPLFSVQGIGVWVIIVTVISALASLAPAWRASRLSVKDVLNYE